MTAKATETKAEVRGKMAPFSMEQVQLIRASLRASKSTRDLAILETGVDTMLRGGDLLRLRVRDVQDADHVMRQCSSIRQDKTDKPVRVMLTEKAQQALAALIKEQGKCGPDYLFTRQGDPQGKHLSEVTLRDIIKGWCKIIHVDDRHYSGHSLRRTKAVHIYRETKNIEAVRKMLGHTSLAHTMQYLGVGDDEVTDLALRFVI